MEENIILPEESISFSFRYEKDQLRKWLSKKRISRKNTVRLFALFLLVFNFLVVVPMTDNKLPPLMMTLLCISLILLVFYQNRKQSLLQLNQLYADGQEYQAVFGEKKFQYTVNGEEASVWYDCTEAEEQENYIKLLFPDGILFLPEDCLDDKGQRKLKRLLKLALAERYKPLK